MLQAVPNLGGLSSTAVTLFSTYTSGTQAIYEQWFTNGPFLCASLAASLMLVRPLANHVIPKVQLRRYIWSPLSSHQTLVINEYCGLTVNHVFKAAEVYLRSKISTPSMEKDQEVTDSFETIKLKWRYSCINLSSSSKSLDNQKRQFELTFHKKHKAKVTESYLPCVLAQAKAIEDKEKVLFFKEDQRKDKEKVVKLYALHGSNSSRTWRWTNLKHPATFETMAMEPELKRMILDDLDRFVKGEEFYRKIGRAWKRGYLLYGPPGTGKSSLIAAMANYLKFDVYDLELTSIHGNSELREVLLSIKNRSILVIEDIYCSVDVQNRAKKLGSQIPYSGLHQKQDEKVGVMSNSITLSGLLNFIDGLWSSCGGDERIIVFTTNHKDKLDPALLRPGRMDVHIHLSYCTPSGFKTLASNYLGIQESNPHRLCGQIEGLMETTEVTPAEVAGELMKSDDADVALEGVVNLLKRKKAESEIILIDQDEGTKQETEMPQTKRQKTKDNNVSKFFKNLSKKVGISHVGSRKRRRQGWP